MLARFDIVLVGFPFTDGPNVKPRPAMVICLSKRHQKVSSRCRLSRMTTLAMPLVRRRIGSLPEDLRPACVQILRQVVGVEA